MQCLVLITKAVQGFAIYTIVVKIVGILLESMAYRRKSWLTQTKTIAMFETRAWSALWLRCIAR